MIDFPYLGRLGAALLLTAALALASCRGRGPEPLTAVPADAEGIVAIAPARVLAARLAPTLDRLPEVVGAVDLVRSLVGIDLREPDRVRHEGLDPDRGVALAWAGEAFLVLLPVSDRAAAGRRLGLRLARLGLIEQDAQGDARRFRGGAGGDQHASLRVGAGLAVVCLGSQPACDQAAAANRGGAEAALGAVRDELALPQADVTGLVRNRGLVRLGRMLGIPLPTSGMAGAMLGDLRLALSLDGGVMVRAAIGSVGEPMSSGLADAFGTGDALQLSVHAGSLPAPWLREGVARLFGGGTDLARRVSGWDGRLLATVPADRAEPVLPLLRPGNLAGLPIGILAGFRNEAAASAMLQELEAVLTRLGGRVTSVDSDASRGLSVSGGGLPEGFAGRVGPVCWWASGLGAAGRALAFGTRPDSTRGSLEAVPQRLARLRVDPGALIEASGVTVIDFVRHLATNLRTVEADLAMDGVRLLLDVAVRVR